MHIKPPIICIYFIILYADTQTLSAYILSFYMQIQKHQTVFKPSGAIIVANYSYDWFLTVHFPAGNRHTMISKSRCS